MLFSFSFSASRRAISSGFLFIIFHTFTTNWRKTEANCCFIFFLIACNWEQKKAWHTHRRTHMHSLPTNCHYLSSPINCVIFFCIFFATWQIVMQIFFRFQTLSNTCSSVLSIHVEAGETVECDSVRGGTPTKCEPFETSRTAFLD